jgi:hypothetical protein
MAARRNVPLSARALILFRELWMPALWIALALPWLAHAFADSAYVIWFRDTVDVPARVVGARETSESRGRTVPRWEGFRVEAEFAYQGRTLRAVGDLSGLPSDGMVVARVPLTRPDLAVAFDGEGPRHPQTPVWLALAALIGVVFLVLIAGANRKLLRLLETGTMAAARCTLQQDEGATMRLDVTYATPRGTVTTTRKLLRSEGRRVLADLNPVLVVSASDPKELFVLSEIPGLRATHEGDGVAPAPWRALLWWSWPIAVLAAVGVYALAVSRILPP